MWALGLQVMVGHLKASCRAGRFHGWESWPGQVVCSKEGVQSYPCSGSPKLSFNEPSLHFRNLLWGGRELGTLVS